MAKWRHSRVVTLIVPYLSPSVLKSENEMDSRRSEFVKLFKNNFEDVDGIGAFEKLATYGTYSDS